MLLRLKKVPFPVGVGGFINSFLARIRLTVPQPDDVVTTRIANAMAILV
jgi:hypothetical protein